MSLLRGSCAEIRASSWTRQPDLAAALVRSEGLEERKRGWEDGVGVALDPVLSLCLVAGGCLSG